MSMDEFEQTQETVSWKPGVLQSTRGSQRAGLSNDNKEGRKVTELEVWGHSTRA